MVRDQSVNDSHLYLHMRTILFFGDSLTAGYGLADASLESFPARIQQKVSEHQLSFQTINAGVSGDTSGGGLARLDYWLHRPVDVFVLELGINDILRGIPPSVTLKNLQSIIDKVKRKNPHVKLALMGMELPAMVPGVMAAEFRGIFRKLADANSITLVPFFLEGVAGQAHLNLPDGLHPSANGYKIIADRVWPVLKSLLQ